MYTYHSKAERNETWMTYSDIHFFFFFFFCIHKYETTNHALIKRYSEKCPSFGAIRKSQQPPERHGIFALGLSHFSVSFMLISFLLSDFPVHTFFFLSLANHFFPALWFLRLNLLPESVFARENPVSWVQPQEGVFA